MEENLNYQQAKEHESQPGQNNWCTKMKLIVDHSCFSSRSHSSSQNGSARTEHLLKQRRLSLGRLGAVMGRDSEQLHQWLTGEHAPSLKNMRMIEQVPLAF